MNLKEIEIARTPLYQGRIISLRDDTVRLPNGKIARRELIEHNGGCCVAALTENKEILLVRQYRYGVDKILWELPAGKLEADESPVICAERELLEETGYQAQQLHSLGILYPTPAYCQEIIHMFWTNQLVPAKQNLDEDEFLEVTSVPFEQAVAMVHKGDLPDAKTQLAILKLEGILS